MYKKNKKKLKRTFQWTIDCRLLVAEGILEILQSLHPTPPIQTPGTLQTRNWGPRGRQVTQPKSHSRAHLGGEPGSHLTTTLYPPHHNTVHITFACWEPPKAYALAVGFMSIRILGFSTLWKLKHFLPKISFLKIKRTKSESRCGSNATEMVLPAHIN